MGGKLRAFNFWPEWYFNFESRALGSSDYTGNMATREAAVEARWLMMVETPDPWQMTSIGHWHQMLGPVVTKYRASQNCSFIRDFSSRTELYQVENTWVILSPLLILFLDQKMTLSLSGLLVRWHVMRHAATCPINRYPGTWDTRLVNYWTERPY